MLAILGWAVSGAAARQKRSPFPTWNEIPERGTFVAVILCVSIFIAALEAVAQDMCTVGHEHDEEEETFQSIRDAAQAPVSWRAPQQALREARAQQGVDNNLHVQLLAINDFHGQLSEGRRVANRPVGSAAVLAAYLKAAQSGMEEQTVIVHAGESALGNLVAGAQRAAMGTDFAFMNPGGIRADIFAGEVTWGELFTVQPFGNSLVKMTLTGQQIYTLLNQQWLNQPFPRILKTSGLTYTWDNNRPVGDRIVEVRKGGVPLTLTADYTVTVNSFVAAGGDNFTVLPQGTNQVGGPIDLDALVDYVESLPQPFAATIEGRITRLN